MKPIFFIVVLCSWIQAEAPHRFGAIDSVSIPDRELNIQREEAVARFVREHPQQPQASPSETEIQNIEDKLRCGYLRQVVYDAARNRAKSELRIFASAAEVEAGRRKVVASAPDPEGQKKQYRERLQALIIGLTAVYDQGRDPQQVYQQLVAPHNIDQSAWAYELYTRRSKEERQKLAQQLAAATPEGFDKAAANYDARPGVENEKLKAAVDAQLAASDPKFKSYLNEYNAGVTHPTPNETLFRGRGIITDYLDQKRNAWWQAETAKLNVTLSDQSLYAACNLPAMGVTVPRH